MALAYKYTGDYVFVEEFKRVTDYFIGHLPKDKVAYWDLCFNDGDNEERDSSAAAIAVCGMLEMCSLLDDKELIKHYGSEALSIIKSLIESYVAFDEPNANGLLLHGVYAKAGFFKKGVDESMIWGDYFFFEALTRIVKNWNPYW